MTLIKLHVAVDIESAISTAIEQVSLTGLGADGTSEYEISDVSISVVDPYLYEVQVTCDRVEGKFVGKDELAEMFAGEVDQLEVDADVSLA